MIGAAGSRHLGQRRRSSLAPQGYTPGSLYTGAYLGGLSERDEDRPPTVTRRRAVNTSDLRSCALVQTKMKTWKHYPE